MKKYILLCGYTSFMIFQVVSIEQTDFSGSLNKLSQTLKHLKHFLSSSKKKNFDTSLSQDIGRQALVYTNNFRQEKKLLTLAWDQVLADLATEHSKNMALGKVKFGHDGFYDRVSQFHFRYRGAAENVFMMSGQKAVAKAAVDGWINSPGHRENLLGNYTVCGIGAYKGQKNIWYVTQIFALRY